METKVDVLVIGAGPAGLMCAQGLKRAGVDVRIIDQRPRKIAAGQADGIQPRTIEVLQSYGLAERLLREGNQMHMVAFYNPSPKGGIEASLDYLPTFISSTDDHRTLRPGYSAHRSRRGCHSSNCTVTLHQGAIEAIFLDTMRSMGLEVDRPAIPTSLEISTNEKELLDPQAYPVKVVLKNLEPEKGKPETEVVHAKFVVGADGAHSWVRKTLGITMDGEQTNYIWGVVDLIPSTDFPDIRNRCAIHSNNGSCMIIPREGDKVRLYIQLSDKDAGMNLETGRIDKSKMGPEQLMEVARKSLEPYRIEKVGEIDWWTIYIIGQRVASKFSVNERVFIAGDACHTHSPKAGQGMNASMNDTHNLIWKMTHVLRGWADISLLKTYEFERRKYAQDLISFDKEFSALFSDKPKTDDNQNGVTHEQFLQAFQTYGSFTSGIGIHYASSTIVQPLHQSQSSFQTIGMRILPHQFIRAADARPFELHDLLPADTRFKLLVFAGDTSLPSQVVRLEEVAVKLEEGVLKKYGRGDGSGGGRVWSDGKGVGRDVFDVVVIGSAKKDKVNYTDIPEVLRSHWSKVLLDDTDMFARVGGGGYEWYGIDRTRGTIVVVRPDGYVGMMAPFEKVEDIEAYFAGFLKG